MRIQFLNDSNDFRSRSGGGSLARGVRKEGTGLFWWTILITLLLGLATFCWFFSIMVFRYPEKPFHYNLLMKLEKLEPITTFDPLKIPNGTFYGARELMSRYYNYNPEQLQMANDLLKRAYIMNFAAEQPVYVKGTYMVIHARPLNDLDVVTSGWVVRARSTEIEDVEVELLLPGAEKDAVPYKVGDSFTLDNKHQICCAINVTRTGTNDEFCVTVTPITYTGFQTLEKEDIRLEAPKRLNMEAPWPVVVLNPAATPVSPDNVTAQAAPAATY